MKKYILAASMVMALAGPASAHQCPSLMGKIDEAMKTTAADADTKAKVMALYDKGKTEHEAGNHDASEAGLNEALKLLGM
ncbi:MAG: hypothetical protein WCE69_17020 [Aestuariivirga sp.]